MDDSLITRISTSDSNNCSSVNYEIDEEKENERNNKLARAIGQILREIIQESNNKSDAQQDIFYSRKIPILSLEDYLKRIIKYSQIEASTLILSVIYIDKICQRKNYKICINNIHRLLLSSILISIKFNEDDFYKNAQYAKIGGISLQEINKLEYEFFTLIDFSLFTSLNKYKKYENYFYELIKSGI
jgi:hypothetical protein